MAPSTTPPRGSSGLTPGQRLTVRLERPAAQGRTVAVHDGLALLVARGAPGEEVEVVVDRVEARHAFAHVVCVLSPAPERVEAPCPHFIRCGGCDLQHLVYPAQLALKRLAFADQLARIGGLEAPSSFEIVPSPAPLRYRDRLDFLLRRDGETLRPAFHGAHGGLALPIDDCRLAPEELTRLAQDIGAALASLPARATPERVRVQAFAKDGAAGIAFAATLMTATPAGARTLARLSGRWLPALLAAHPAIAHLAVAVRPQSGKERGGQQHGGEDNDDTDYATVFHGEPLLTRRIGKWNYRVPPQAFFQVHAGQAELLVTHVMEELSRSLGTGKGGTSRAVFDLFCGTGLFSLPLAAAGYRVLGIEASAGAVRAARVAAREAQARQEFGVGGRKPEFKVRNLDGKGALEEIVQQAGRPAAVVLDPPRRGLSAHLARSLLAVRPAVVVYVSCDGGTFARDAARLAARYHLAYVTGFDLFPQTHHLEIVGTFLLRGLSLTDVPARPGNAARAPTDAPDNA